MRATTTACRVGSYNSIFRITLEVRGRLSQTAHQIERVVHHLSRRFECFAVGWQLRQLDPHHATTDSGVTALRVLTDLRAVCVEELERVLLVTVHGVTRHDQSLTDHR